MRVNKELYQWAHYRPSVENKDGKKPLKAAKEKTNYTQTDVLGAAETLQTQRGS